jgi:phosphate transport system substrate-binding protein
LGYIELAYALQNNIAYANVKNPAGKFVKPSLDSISAAAATAKLDDNFQIDLINQAGDNAYPVSATSYGLFSKSYTDKAKGEAMVGFLWYVLHKGQEDAKAANYAPLPAAIVTKIEEQVKKITVAGAPVIK